MTEIPLNSRNKRPQFFDDQGIDPLVTMNMELMAELWVVKERQFVLESLIAESGMNVKERIESYRFSDAEQQELEAARRKYVETLMRAFSAEFINRETLQNDRDAMTQSMKNADAESSTEPLAEQ